MKIKNLKFFSSKTKPISITYDTYNKESIEIINHIKTKGLNLHISSIILPFFKVSGNINQETKQKQLFTTFSFPNILYQFCFGTDKNIQYRHTAIIGPILNKWHTVINSQYIYTQIESIYQSLFYNLGIKLINPALGLSNFIYIINYTRSLKNIEMGIEVTGIGNRMGIGIISRLVNGDTVYSLGIKQFTEIGCNFYHKINKLIEIGGEIIYEKSKKLSGAIGIRLSNTRSILKMNLNEQMEIGLNWEERLSNKILLNFIGTIDKNGFEYSIGFIYD